MSQVNIPLYYVEELQYKIEEMVPLNVKGDVIKILEQFIPSMTTVSGINTQLPSLINALQTVVPATRAVPIPSTADIEKIDIEMGETWADYNEPRVLVLGARSDEHVDQIMNILGTTRVEVYEVPHVLASQIRDDIIVHKDLPLNERYDIIYAPMCIHHLTGGLAVVRKLVGMLNSGGILVITDYDGNDFIAAQSACIKVTHAIIDDVLYAHKKYQPGESVNIPVNIIATKMMKITLETSAKSKTTPGQVIVNVDADYRDTFDSSVTYYYKKM